MNDAQTAGREHAPHHKHPDEGSEGLWIEMRDRLRSVIGERSSEEVGRQTGVSGESVRRYLMGHVPSARFLSRLCVLDSLDGTWLLTGAGQPKQGSTHSMSLENIDTDQLLSEIGKRLDRLTKPAGLLQALDLARAKAVAIPPTRS